MYILKSTGFSKFIFFQRQKPADDIHPVHLYFTFSEIAFIQFYQCFKWFPVGFGLVNSLNLPANLKKEIYE
jgi:hypothetical protein